MIAKQARRRIRATATRSLPAVMGALPEAAGRRLCVWIGRSGHLLVGRDRRLAFRNLRRVYPEWSPAETRRFARRVFEEIGANAYDFVRYPSLGRDERRRLVRIEGGRRLEEALSRGRGVVLVTGHLGCWEILGAALVEAGFPVKAVARPLREPRLDRVLREHRGRMGVETISSLALPVAAVRHLRRGGVLGVLADQRIREGGTVVNFLGQPTRMTDAAARLAGAAGAALVPVGIRRLSDHRHEVTVLEAIGPGGGAREPTQRVARALEGLIRRTPEQWMWIHPRWEEELAAPVPETARPGHEPRNGAGREENVCVSS